MILTRPQKKPFNSQHGHTSFYFLYKLVIVCVIQNGSANYWKQTTCNLTD